MTRDDPWLSMKYEAMGCAMHRYRLRLEAFSLQAGYMLYAPAPESTCKNDCYVATR
jgi:hypothetical protein